MSLQKRKGTTKKGNDLTTPQNKTYSPEDIITWRHNNPEISTYTHKSAVRTLCGAVCVVLGAVTLPIPTGSIFLILLGGGLLGYDVKGLFNRVKYEVRLIKLRVLQKC